MEGSPADKRQPERRMPPEGPLFSEQRRSPETLIFTERRMPPETGTLPEAYVWGITTSIKGGHDQAETARQLAETYRVPYVVRGEAGLRELKEAGGLDFLLTLDRDGSLFMEEPLLRWHPSMALPRLRQLARPGKENREAFLAAADLAPGDRFLDCTLGLASDALVAAMAAGEEGAVLGLEASPVIAAITGRGLSREAARFDSKKVPLAAFARRIRVLAAGALDYLKTQEDESWDVVYFDPMFRRGNHNSSGMNSLRPAACHDPFGPALLAEAFRVAAKRVVLKERWFSPLFRQLGAGRTEKTRYSPVAYGVWDKQDFARRIR